MVFSYYIYKYPYKISWYIKSLFGLDNIAFYCADPLDYEMFEHINKYLPKVTIIAKNKKTKIYLSAKGINYKTMPVFPKVVIMGRHEHYKFDVKRIIKIGFDHGLYQFKRWTSNKYYNGFDVYFVSSQDQVEIAKKRGIKSTVAIGYPKLDNAFNGTYNDEYLNKIRLRHNINSSKKTIIFTTTWNVDGLSAIEKWIYRINELTDDFNILLTAHTWTEPKLLNELKNIKNAVFLEEFDITPYLMIADIFVGDYNSLIGEFCSFDKPIITFKVPDSDRSIPEVKELIKKISIQIDEFSEIKEAINKCIQFPTEKSEERQKANKILFYKLDGLAGKRAADIILNLMENK
ncbi:MAG: CDP-glycerol glycerophosphotransferase family protein [Ignavibacteriales bacterium]|nr:CDP-glycerol glycerophosphotransferase family protein [Ignavibacteriales bacterium]